jgi:lipid II:glycine glycyltransferase (peptidoglycan interpeptide bridge formation enzyme)
VVIFETATVAHAQYGAVSDEGRRIRALDALYMFLINYYRQSKRWFDFGISSEQDGRVLNPGLANQKEEFGGTGVAYDTYRMSVR